ncbi:hypothetical protein PYCC9005_003366 [Savitreella phatthalungensis]
MSFFSEAASMDGLDDLYVGFDDAKAGTPPFIVPSQPVVTGSIDMRLAQAQAQLPVQAHAPQTRSSPVYNQYAAAAAAAAAVAAAMPESVQANTTDLMQWHEPWALTAPFPAAPRSYAHFKSTLHAATAMVKSADEIPLTYLNKSQAYVLSIGELRPEECTYRTTVKVLFDEHDSAERIAGYWRLWRDGRGLAEALERSADKVRAIECDLAATNTSVANFARQKVQCAVPKLVSESFDGFTIEWSGDAKGTTCIVAVRCHFLSTDFSHSKGVRGVTLRLAIQTERVSSPGQPLDGAACLIKLFRDKGAERKSSNDTQHVKKAISKLESGLEGATAGQQRPVSSYGHRRRDSEVAMGAATKRERANSGSSDESLMAAATGAADSRNRLFQLEAMLHSSRASTSLDLPLEPMVDMTIDPTDPIGAIDEQQGQQSSASSHTGLRTDDLRSSATGSNAAIAAAAAAYSRTSGRLGDGRSTSLSPPQQQQQPYRQHVQPGPSVVPDATGKSIVASGVDRAYRLQPAHQQLRPAKVVYVQPVGQLTMALLAAPISLPGGSRVSPSHGQYASPPLSLGSPSMSDEGLRWPNGPPPMPILLEQPVLPASAPPSQQQQQQQQQHVGAVHLAVYLSDLTGAAFSRALLGKIKLAGDASSIDDLHCVRENGSGLRILMDDDLVRNMRDGQTMLFEVRYRRGSVPVHGRPSPTDIELVVRWNGY